MDEAYLRQAPSLLTVLGVVCIGGAVLMSARDALIVARGDTTQATVVDFAKPDDPEHVPCPIVEFVDASGGTQRATSRTCSSPSDYAKGDTVEVHYEPDDPDDVVVGSLFGVLGLYLGVLTAGLFLLGIGVVLTRIQKPSR